MIKWKSDVLQATGGNGADEFGRLFPLPVVMKWLLVDRQYNLIS